MATDEEIAYQVARDMLAEAANALIWAQHRYNLAREFADEAVYNLRAARVGN